MPTLQQIKAQIEAIPQCQIMVSKKEVSLLPDILTQDEIIEHLTEGFNGEGTGLLIASNKRVLFVMKKVFSGFRMEDVAYDKISSIDYSTSFASGKLKIHLTSNTLEFSYIGKDDVKKFSDFVRNKISSLSNKSTMSADTSSTLMADLERLIELKKQDLLTEEEFIAMKKKLIN